MQSPDQSTSNRVLHGGLAIIDGKTTGLAGCLSSGSCHRAVKCLRVAPELAYRVTHDCGQFGRFFIPIGSTGELKN